jgi:hypothetical protein
VEKNDPSSKYYQRRCPLLDVLHPQILYRLYVVDGVVLQLLAGELFVVSRVNNLPFEFSPTALIVCI